MKWNVSKVFMEPASRLHTTARRTFLMAYVNNTWISSRLWPASCWSAYRSSVRTNNDVEGWHNRLNRQTRNGKLDLYQLACVLYAEAEYVDVQAVLVRQNRLRRHQRRTYRKVQGRLHEYWRRYAAGELTTSQLLRGLHRVETVGSMVLYAAHFET